MKGLMNESYTVETRPLYPSSVQVGPVPNEVTPATRSVPTVTAGPPLSPWQVPPEVPFWLKAIHPATS